MTDAADRTWIGFMPATYDRCLGPAVFGPHAAELAGRAAADGARAVLELAAGTGMLTRQLVRRLPGAQVTATDLSPATGFCQGTPLRMAIACEADGVVVRPSAVSVRVRRVPGRCVRSGGRRG